MSRYKYELLLCAQLILAAISPLFSATVAERLMVNSALTLVFATALYIAANTRRHFIIGLCLMVPSFVLLWGARLDASRSFELLAYAGAAAFLCYITFLILADIVSARLVTFDVIAGGISVYLLFGNIWGLLYAIIGRLDPTAFIIPEATAVYLGDSIGNTSSAMYFSFVTLTTLGYGDITPVNTLARTLAYLEAAVGQVYLTVLIASLVGMHLAHKSTNGDKHD